MTPVVRYMILCEEVVRDSFDRTRVSAMGLISNVVSKADPPFPCRAAPFHVLLMLTEGRGRAGFRIQVVHEIETPVVVMRSSVVYPDSPHDPLEVYAIAFRLAACVFPAAGLYAVQVWYNDEVLAEYPLRLR